MNTSKIYSRPLMPCILLLLCATSWGQEVETSDGWRTERQGPGLQLMTFEMTLHGKPEAQPALKYRLIPDRFDQVDGNAAIYYLKAMGYFEESQNRQALEQFEREAAAEAEQTGADEYPPYSWLSTPPQDLPVDEVKAFVRRLDFQTDLLREATRRRQFSLDRRIREFRDPIVYLLPEIQVMRQLARYQSPRTRLAIAEGRIDDAIEAVGNQIALAHHLGTDEFFVSTLVGAAVASIAWNDVVHLLNHPDTPNLYWAFASLPRPLIDMQEAGSFERQLLFEQVKCLRDVTEKVRPAGYWQDFLDRFEAQMKPILEYEAGMKLDNRAATVAVLAAAYPGARKFLSQELRMSDEQIEQYPRVQVVMLAMKRYYEVARDEQFKWDYLPFPIANTSPDMLGLSDRLIRDAKEYGWITEPAGILLPAVPAIRNAQQRNEQQIAMVQTVEAIRHHVATHDGKLPVNLADLALPAPHDPVSGKPFQYDYRVRNNATLTGAKMGAHSQYRLVLQVAEQ